MTDYSNTFRDGERVKLPGAFPAPKKKFQVVIVKPVMDYLRAFVEVEAETAEEAEQEVLEMLGEWECSGKVNLVYWCSGDCLEATTAEATELQEAAA